MDSRIGRAGLSEHAAITPHTGIGKKINIITKLKSLIIKNRQKTMTSTAAYIKAPWRTELRNVELPAHPPCGWVRLRIDACGICGTDVSAAINGAENWQPFGHEIAGTVVAVGDGVDTKRLPEGTTVVVESASACGLCDSCRNVRADLCQGGAPNIWGQPALGFSTFMDAPACACVPYSGLEPEVASLVEPAGVAFDMVLAADIKMGDRVCVVGPGPIALVAVALAFRRGASEVVCIGRKHSKARLALAEMLGAMICHSEDKKGLDALKGKFNHVLMTAPVDAIPGALEYLAYGGIMTYIGIGTGDPVISFDANDFHFRKLQLRASYASPAMYFPAVISLMKSGAIPGKALISHRLPLGQIQHALDLNRNNKSEVIKIVVIPEGAE
ncbi:MAG: alcohol dehydrogenase catalytic domain-containing protein [Lentisphaerae bacterium]|nr:alcohol dehydrogenase catalytic domain-containing protein [Lentisphaerota bacterium]